jgi:hypothetical protein
MGFHRKTKINVVFLWKTADKCDEANISYRRRYAMNIIDMFFTSEWVSTLFTVIFASIAARFFVLPLSFEREQATRIVLMKRREERKNEEENAII